MRWMIGFCFLILAMPVSAVDVTTTEDFDALVSAVAEIEARVVDLESAPVDPPVDPPVVGEPPVDFTPATPPFPDWEVSSCDGLSPCIELRPEDLEADELAYKNALQDMSKVAGYVVIHPGVYVPAFKPWFGIANGLQVIGVLKDGVRPTIVQGLSFNGVGISGTWGFKNLHFVGQIGGGSKDNKVVGWFDNVWMQRGGHGWMLSYEYDKAADGHFGSYRPGQPDDEWYIHNSVCSESGTHCLYSDRNAYTEVYRSTFHSCGYHCVKIASQRYAAVQNKIMNTALDGGPFPNYYNGTPRYGTTPFSFVSCQSGVLLENEITHKVESSLHLIGRQPRSNLKGCEIPPYDSATFNDPDYWLAPDQFVQRWERNEINLLPSDSGTDYGMVVFRNAGTYPLWKPPELDQGSTVLDWLPAPQGWLERSKTILCGNTITGLTGNDIISEDRYWGQIVPDPAVLPPEPIAQTFVEDCQ